VLADAVEAHRLGQLDVPPQGRVVRGRLPGVRPVPLVDDQPQGERPAVEDELVALHPDRPQGRVTPHVVDDGPELVGQLQMGLDQRRPLRAPEQLVAVVVDSRVGQRDPPEDFPGNDPVGVVGQEDRAGPQDDAA
jgi:hypothetical protein